MRATTKTVLVLIVICAIGAAAALGLAQKHPKNAKPPAPAAPGVPSPDLPRIEFSINNEADVRELVARREIAIHTATRALSARGDQEPSEDVIVRAAKLLGDLKADDSLAIQALIAKMEFSPEVSVVGEGDSLESLPVAGALRRIGGRNVIQELLGSLRGERTVKEHRIIANLLISCDSPEMAPIRVRSAIEKERLRKDPDPDYISQLESIKYWVENPHLLRNP
jgi:hypothetical protein